MKRFLIQAKAFDGRHPWCGDVALALVSAAASVSASPALDPLTVPFVVLVNGAVAFRRCCPLTALVVAVGGITTLAALATAGRLPAPWTFLAAWILLFAVGRRRPGAFIVGAPLAAVTALAAFLAPAGTPEAALTERWSSFLPVAAMSLAALLAGSQVRITSETIIRRREEAMRAAVNDERARIAREMHDIIGHNLSVITSLANGGSIAVRSSPGDAARVFAEIGAVSRTSMREVADVLRLLRAPDERLEAAPPPQPNWRQFAALVDSVRFAGLRISFESSGELSSLSAGRRLAIYRIVQEALTNALKHAGPGASVTVTVASDSEATFVTVADDGGPGEHARSAPAAEPGYGLIGMRERTEAFGGWFEADGTVCGWRVRAWIPHERPEGLG
ncbi:sensor histidine kinase [Streptosporangium sp. NPDC000509]|uniref:sensor histidine kinase n=1 Tax=Streptosporangium sp. NPDC000509 TaxID=3366186 RepID=UPI0036A100DC